MDMAGRRAAIGDAVLAVAVTAVAIVTTAVLGWVPQPATPVDATGVALLAVAGLVLAARRRWPLATLATTTVAVTGYTLLGYPFGLVFLPFAVAVYTVARHLPQRVSVPASLAALALLLSHVVTHPVDAFAGVLFGSGWAAVPFAVGLVVRARLELAARTRAELIRTHVDEERLRVAQEVHDIVGHGLAAIKMQAGIALHLRSRKPEQAQEALAAIDRTSTDALEELRATLAAVREPDAGPPRSPSPGLSRLDELRQRMAEAGLQVTVEVAGPPRELPPPVDLAAYRIVQESLTNALRHGDARHPRYGDARHSRYGDARHAAVTVSYSPYHVEIVVTNPAGGAPDTASGSGIAGMRQRAQALGGTFHAGAAGGRFEVRARLPIGGGA